jgi:hypothetical protein
MLVYIFKYTLKNICGYSMIGLAECAKAIQSKPTAQKTLNFSKWKLCGWICQMLFCELCLWLPVHCPEVAQLPQADLEDKGSSEVLVLRLAGDIHPGTMPHRVSLAQKKDSPTIQYSSGKRKLHNVDLRWTYYCICFYNMMLNIKYATSKDMRSPLLVTWW